MIEINDVSYTINNVQILNDVTLWLNPGEVLAVLGQNGSGKSTLLKLITGEISSSKGEIYINGRSLETMPLLKRAQLRAVLPQSSNLSFSFSVEEVVSMGRSPLQDEKLESGKAIISKAMELTDVIALRKRSFVSLSGGEKQRVQLARVLAQIWPESDNHVPRYLLLDEPTAA